MEMTYDPKRAEEDLPKPNPKQANPFGAFGISIAAAHKKLALKI